jgi:phospholipase/carboxylesterase
MFDQTPQELATHFMPATSKGHGHAKKTMLVFHGQGDCKESYISLIKEINLTGLDAILIDAPYRAQIAPGMSGHFWYHPEPSLQEKTLRKSLTLACELIARLNKNGSAHDEMFLFGFSAGARVVMNLVNQSAIPFAGAIALSPRFKLVDDMKVKNATPCLITHGLYDEVIPFQETEAAAKKWIHHNAGQFHHYNCGHEIIIEEIQLIRLWLSDYM